VTGEKLSRVEEGLPEYVLRIIYAIPRLTQRYLRPIWIIRCQSHVWCTRRGPSRSRAFSKW
jgi:hypothetical protein